MILFNVVGITTKCRECFLDALDVVVGVPSPAASMTRRFTWFLFFPQKSEKIQMFTRAPFCVVARYQNARVKRLNSKKKKKTFNHLAARSQASRKCCNTPVNLTNCFGFLKHVVSFSFFKIWATVKFADLLLSGVSFHVTDKT